MALTNTTFSSDVAATDNSVLLTATTNLGPGMYIECEDEIMQVTKGFVAGTAATIPVPVQITREFFIVGDLFDPNGNLLGALVDTWEEIPTTDLLNRKTARSGNILITPERTRLRLLGNNQIYRFFRSFQRGVHEYRSLSVKGVYDRAILTKKEMKAA